MGKGDKRTKRGKLFNGSRGKVVKRKAAPVAKPEPKATRAPRARKETVAPVEAAVEPTLEGAAE